MDQIKNLTLPILITRGLVLFPKNADEILVGREFSKNALEIAKNDSKELYVVTQVNPTKENDLTFDDIYKVGVKCIIQDITADEDCFRVKVLPTERVQFEDLLIKENAYFASAISLPDVIEEDQTKEGVYVNRISEVLRNVNIETLFGKQKNSFFEKISGGLNALDLSYLFSAKLNLETNYKQELLEAKNVIARFELLLQDFEIIKLRVSIDSNIQTKLKKNTEKQQKEYYLREQIKAIKQELNGDDGEDDENEITRKLAQRKYPEEVVAKVNSELKRMEAMPQGTLEYSLILDYLELLLDLPFDDKTTQDIDDLNIAKKVLDDDHYGLDKVKERIIEYLAIKQLNGNLKAPILCFYGPPGTGKTSLSISIAKALGRKFIKCSLGGISDEAEIRGHRRTYVGSKPGRIITSLKNVGVSNPVVCLDEIDKIAHDSFKGDPSSALLEVLDPEQNTHFRDNYLEVDYDLSNCLFIATCNYLENVPEPLRDRLELIPVDSYTLLEKVKIAEFHLIKKEAKNISLDPEKIKFKKEAIEYIIEHYTREAGVRDLSRKIGTILRKTVVEQLSKNKLGTNINVGIKEVKKCLGIEIFDSTEKEREAQIGIVTGLAYTQYGGDILPIEVNFFDGKGGLVLTGNLGNVMKESCSIALDYVKANAKKYDIDPEVFSKVDVHIHVPEGAVPKDGPSAGIAITTAIISAFTKREVSGDIAMTGEVNLRGKALAIGGLREKTLAALRSGIKTVIVPKTNKKNIEELPNEIKTNLNVIYMDNVDDALKICLK